MARKPENLTEQEIKDAKFGEKYEMLVCMFISSTNKEILRALNTELLNDYTKVVNNWSTSVDEVIQLLNTYLMKKNSEGVQMMHVETTLLRGQVGIKQKKMA